ncbi:glycosyltransferase [Catellatospora sp. NPDC049609]|uniref:glycosyltransferase n=1 Tax=Catellatospora sp. NPDC049609 TaxID=3155505 RepID=UPI003424A88F
MSTVPAGPQADAPAGSTPDPAGGVVVIWRSGLLSGSETFIRNHGTALTRWRPVFLGATRIASPLAAADDVVAYPDGPRGRAAFLRLRLTGRSPRVQALLRRLRPAVVHAHFGGDGWLISDSAARLGVPLVVTVHGHDVTRQPASPGARGARYRRNLRQAFDRAAVVIAVSEFIRGRAIALGADPAKVRVHHTGVPIPPAPREQDKQWDVLFVGRFVAKKGVDDLLEAVALLGSRPRVLLIGSGPLEAVLRERAAALGVDATFLGALHPAAVSGYMAQSRIFVSPSRTAPDGDTEGLPTTILEAAAMRVPTVSTYHSGIPEAVVHGETGLLCAEGDREALAAHIGRLLADDELRERMGRQARRHVVQRFDLARQTMLLEELYAQLASREPARPAS